MLGPGSLYRQTGLGLTSAVRPGGTALKQQGDSSGGEAHFQFTADFPVVAGRLVDRATDRGRRGLSWKVTIPTRKLGRHAYPERVSEWVVETRGLIKRYGRLLALDGLDLQVSRGAIGLLGPNGAGKSTLIKCLLRLHRITSGSARLLGAEVQKEGRDIRRRVGYTPEQDCHVPGMVGCEYVTYCAQLSGLPFDAARQRAHEMLDFVGMGQERYRRVDTYSTGMKQRLKLAQAVVHDPEVVFLDEPTNGLDPKGQAQMLQLIQSLWREHGMTVILSTHLLNDVDLVCDQIILLAQGRLLVHDTLDHLKAQRRGAAEVVVGQREEDLAEACRHRGWPSEVLSNGHVRVEHGGDELTAILEVLKKLDLAPLEITPSPNALEEMYIQALETSNGTP